MKPFKITVNWYGEIHTIWTHAISPHRAVKNASCQLHKKGISYKPGYIYKKMIYGDVQYDIKKEVKEDE